ncbi:MAG: hypothetical protein IJD79_00700 [Clostridia bacterium]|nr:hypothetical protein [Clostridia bacterium]
MNKNNQIQEMAKVLYESDNKRNVVICGVETVAEDIYNAGYRKASEVAEDIIRILRAAGINEHRYPVIAELKKKYTEEGK